MIGGMRQSWPLCLYSFSGLQLSDCLKSWELHFILIQRVLFNGGRHNECRTSQCNSSVNSIKSCKESPTDCDMTRMKIHEYQEYDLHIRSMSDRIRINEEGMF